MLWAIGELLDVPATSYAIEVFDCVFRLVVAIEVKDAVNSSRGQEFEAVSTRGRGYEEVCTCTGNAQFGTLQDNIKLCVDGSAAVVIDY